MTLATCTLPIRTQSEANLREHWAARAKRSRQQRGLVGLLFKPAQSVKQLAATVGVRINMTRVRPKRCRALDPDNCGISFKHVQDGIADVLGIDDGDPRLQWNYGQAVGSEYAVTVEILAAESCRSVMSGEGRNTYRRRKLAKE